MRQKSLVNHGKRQCEINVFEEQFIVTHPQGLLYVGLLSSIINFITEYKEVAETGLLH